MPECALNLSQAAAYLAWRRSRTPARRRSPGPAPTCSEQGAADPPSYLQDAHYPAPGSWAGASATSTRTTLPDGVSDQRCCPRGWRTAATGSRPAGDSRRQLRKRMAEIQAKSGAKKGNSL